MSTATPIDDATAPPDARLDDACKLRGLLHDMQQPLAVVGLLLELIARSDELPDGVLSRVQLAACETKSALGLLAGEMSARGQLSPVVPVDVHDNEPCDVGTVVRELLATRTAVTAARVHVVHRSAPLVTLPASAVRRTLDNVVQNAMRAAGPGGMVRITVSRVRLAAVIDVEDSGPGFGMISRGSGIGLLSAVGMISAAGGSVTFGSSRLGGSRVSVKLPPAPP